MEEKIKIRLCHDTIFKSVFLREKRALLQAIYDITKLNEVMSFEEVITGYELESYRLNGKINKSDMLVKLGKNYYLNIEVNYRHEKDVIYRNSLQLFRICAQITESGLNDKELSYKKVGQLNFNTFSNNNNKELQKGVYADDISGDIINDMVTFWNLDIVKCYKRVYNNIKEAYKLPKEVRWGAILYMYLDDIEDIAKVIGDDLLSMEEKDRFINRIKEVKDDKRIIQEWMVEANNKMREENVIKTAREEGIEQGIDESKNEIILNMLSEGSDYSFISKVTGKTIQEIKKIEKN